MTILKELSVDFSELNIPLFEALDESIITASRNGKIPSNVKGIKEFFKKNPRLTIAAAAKAVDTYAKFKSTKRNTIRLFAKDAYERKMMTKIVNMLTNSKQYKVEKTMYAKSSGRVWVLKKL